MLIFILYSSLFVFGLSQVPEDDPEITVIPQEKEMSLLQSYKEESFGVQEVLKEAEALTQRKLNYRYGSADPTSGGLDCSGMIYYVLTKVGIKGVPRQSSDMYMWVRRNESFHAVWSSDLKTFELDALRPGDLLFWTGTYKIDRDPPITHVMIYAGSLLATGKKVMIGSSEGRSFEGKPQYGVSLFDFKLPGINLRKESTSEQGRFIGYGKIPGIEKITSNPQ